MIYDDPRWDYDDPYDWRDEDQFEEEVDEEYDRYDEYLDWEAE